MTRRCLAIPALLVSLVLLDPSLASAQRRAWQDSQRPVLSLENVITSSALLNQYRQIVIEGLVVEVDSAEARRWGVEMIYQRNEAKAPTNNFEAGVLNTPNNFPIGGVPIFTPGAEPPITIDPQPIGAGMTFNNFETDTYLFQSRVRAAVTNGKAHILSQPIAVARTGAEVKLITADEIPFLDVAVQGGEATTDSNLQELATVSPDFFNKKAGITLNVIPELRPPNRILLKVKELNVGQLSGFSQIRGVARPIIQNSTVETEVELANDESLLISGIKRTSEVRQRSGVPVLKDLPVLGLLFGSNTVVNERVDILFMITPHLLDPGATLQPPRDFKNTEFFQVQ